MWRRQFSKTPPPVDGSHQRERERERTWALSKWAREIICFPVTVRPVLFSHSTFGSWLVSRSGPLLHQPRSLQRVVCDCLGAACPPNRQEDREDRRVIETPEGRRLCLFRRYRCCLWETDRVCVRTRESPPTQLSVSNTGGTSFKHLFL